MKRATLACFVTALACTATPARADDFRSSAPPSAVSRPLPPPAIREAKLPNGVRVLVVERHGGLPIVSLRVVSDIGALEAEPGVGYLAAESALWGENDLARSFNEISAQRGVRANWDGVHVSVTCLAPALDRAIELAWNTANEASFHATYVKDAHAGAIRAREDQRWSATRALDEALYPSGDPMHDGMWATAAQAEAVKPAQLESYFARAFTADHVTLIVVGDATLEAVTESARRWLGGARPTTTAAVAAPPLPNAPRRGLTVVDHPGSTQSSIALGALAVARSSPDLAAIDVLAAALRRRLDQILRERYGYTYGFDARVMAGRTRGRIVVEGKVETSRTGESVKALLAAIEQLRTTPLDDAELAVAKSLRRYLDPRHGETNAAAADALVSLVEQGLPLDTWPREIAAVDRVTKDDVLRVARAYLDPEHVPIVVVGDAKVIVPSLPDLGETKPPALIPLR